MIRLRLARARLFARLLVVSSVCALPLGLPAAAHAGLAWSAAAAVDPHAQTNGMTAVACPSTTECVGVDGRGNAVIFNPQAPQTPSTAPLSTHPLTAVACPTSTQCS